MDIGTIRIGTEEFDILSVIFSRGKMTVNFVIPAGRCAKLSGMASITGPDGVRAWQGRKFHEQGTSPVGAVWTVAFDITLPAP